MYQDLHIRELTDPAQHTHQSPFYKWKRVQTGDGTSPRALARGPDQDWNPVRPTWQLPIVVSNASLSSSAGVLASVVPQIPWALWGSGSK